ncbi:MAG TPA: 23S rRNA (pseudouridine(1915)-N(3))-methyltransferase RlmH [Gemmatimonadales bacterium]|nr:23S rRNA (pseudouridine(1915)-N(3))-methyltransferase RlmH [Gemmatimonadales bacterium]
MRILLVAIGRARGELAPAIADYESRAGRYWPLEVVEVRAESARSLSPDEVREREGRRLVQALPAGARVWACDERGRGMTSAEFAEALQRQQFAAQDLAIVIGGAYGLHEIVRSRADLVLSVAPFTLPHDLARLVLAEQLYRAGTIARGEPYHK